MTPRASKRRLASGLSLIEMMVALSILLVGLVGLMRMQVMGMYANQASRAHTMAVQLANELAGALQRLPWESALVQPSATAATTPPAVFGKLLDGTSLPTSGFVAWSDASHAATLPSVRTDAQLAEFDPDGTPVYARRWTVWGYAAPGGTLGGKVIAVSVVFHERGSAIPYEVVVYAQQGNPGAAFANAAAYQ
ncbi:MAG TPA: prepilin-type N-terminal cleavage/methylation domain-containing protein [Anaeromyxobacteraceae bacterium]|nr:prepilin-type N-terminal cleavage/methylation domain-containing protein [Anaeromyxobacteraceae bacterium]